MARTIEIPDEIMTASQAQRRGLKCYRSARPCPRCGGNIRLVMGNKCRPCKLAWYRNERVRDPKEPPPSRVNEGEDCRPRVEAAYWYTAACRRIYGRMPNVNEVWEFMGRYDEHGFESMATRAWQEATEQEMAANARARRARKFFRRKPGIVRTTT